MCGEVGKCSLKQQRKYTVGLYKRKREQARQKTGRAVDRQASMRRPLSDHRPRRTPGKALGLLSGLGDSNPAHHTPT